MCLQSYYCRGHRLEAAAAASTAASAARRVAAEGGLLVARLTIPSLPPPPKPPHAQRVWAALNQSRHRPYNPFPTRRAHIP